jgi:hypothetical protein
MSGQVRSHCGSFHASRGAQRHVTGRVMQSGALLVTCVRAIVWMNVARLSRHVS